MIITMAVMATYFVWLFPGLFGTMFAWLVQYSEWAIRLPVIAAVYMILFIVLWIGYTMAMTGSLMAHSLYWTSHANMVPNSPGNSHTK